MILSAEHDEPVVAPGVRILLDPVYMRWRLGFSMTLKEAEGGSYVDGLLGEGAKRPASAPTAAEPRAVRT